MKKFFALIFSSVALLSFFQSCDNPENEYVIDSSRDNIFTVREITGSRVVVSPEFQDTIYWVSNADKYGFEVGYRARMILREYFDSNTMKYPECTVEKIVETLPVYPLTPADAIDASEYTTPVSGFKLYFNWGYDELPIWVWDNIQNINIKYKGDNPSFAMTVIGVDGDCIELQLLIKADGNTAQESTKLLSFDLNGLGAILTENEKSSLASYETLKTVVYFKKLDEDGSLKNEPTEECEFDNPFRSK